MQQNAGRFPREIVSGKTDSENTLLLNKCVFRSEISVCGFLFYPGDWDLCLSNRMCVQARIEAM